MYGCGPASIILRHIFPNIGSSVFVYAMVSLSRVILEISSLSFLGLSAKPAYTGVGIYDEWRGESIDDGAWQALAQELPS